MQTDPVEANKTTENSWTYDAGSGRTIATESAWIMRNKKDKKAVADPRTPANQPTEQPPINEQTLKSSPTQQQRRPKMPPLPLDDFKIVYRPQAGLDLAKWNTVAVTHAIGRVSGLSQQDFNDKVRVQFQRMENLIPNHRKHRRQRRRQEAGKHPENTAWRKFLHCERQHQNTGRCLQRRHQWLDTRYEHRRTHGWNSRTGKIHSSSCPNARSIDRGSRLL